FGAAAATTLILSAIFVVVYGTTNWLATRRTDLETCHFDWELSLPFVPWLIIPYMSIDLFFLAAPFLCRDLAELKTLAGRVVFAILTAGACFALFPLRLAYPKPELTGWIGWGFNLFLELDRPHNLLPSLHIALQTILLAAYLPHTRGWVRAALVV